MCIYYFMLGLRAGCIRACTLVQSTHPQSVRQPPPALLRQFEFKNQGTRLSDVLCMLSALSAEQRKTVILSYTLKGSSVDLASCIGSVRAFPLTNSCNPFMRLPLSLPSLLQRGVATQQCLSSGWLTLDHFQAALNVTG